MPTLRDGPAASNATAASAKSANGSVCSRNAVLQAPLPCSHDDRRKEEHDRKGGELHAGKRRQAAAQTNRNCVRRDGWASARTAAYTDRSTSGYASGSAEMKEA